jgi:hypothetical protein
LYGKETVMSQLAETTLTIQLAFADEQQQGDPATIATVTREGVTALREYGYDVTPVYTGAKGGDLFQIIQQIAPHIPSGTIAFLTVLFGVAKPIAETLKARLTPKPNEMQPSSTAKVTIIIDGGSMIFEASDAKTAAQLAERFAAEHPTIARLASERSKVQINVVVPSRSRRTRR